MWRVIGAVGLSLVIFQGQTAQAQPGGGRDEIKKLQGELERLRTQLQEVEGHLKKATDGPGKKDEKRPEGKKGFEEWMKMMEKMKEGKEGKPGDKKGDKKGGKEGSDKGRGGEFKRGPGGFGKGPWGEFKGGPPWGKGKGPGAGGDFRRPGSRDDRGDGRGSADFERRLDRIIRELEDLRRDARRR